MVDKLRDKPGMIFLYNRDDLINFAVDLINSHFFNHPTNRRPHALRNSTPLRLRAASYCPDRRWKWQEKAYRAHSHHHCNSNRRYLLVFSWKIIQTGARYPGTLCLRATSHRGNSGSHRATGFH